MQKKVMKKNNQENTNRKCPKKIAREFKLNTIKTAMRSFPIEQNFLKNTLGIIYHIRHFMALLDIVLGWE